MDEGHTRTGKPRSSLEKPRVTALLAGKMGKYSLGLSYKGLSNLCNQTAVSEELRPRMSTLRKVKNSLLRVKKLPEC